MENQTSQASSSPVSPENGSSGSSSPTSEIKIVFEELMEKQAENTELKLRIAQLTEALEKKEQSEAASFSEALAGMASLTQSGTNTPNENAKLLQSRMCTVDEVFVDGKINYGQLKYKMLMVKLLKYNGDRYLADGIKISLEYPDFQICVTHQFKAFGANYLLGLSRVFYSNIMVLDLSRSSITYSEYKKLVASDNFHTLTMSQSDVIDEFGNKMKVADILKEVPNIKEFSCTFKNSDTAPELSQIPLLPKLRIFWVIGLQDNFNIQEFSEFIKRHPNASYCLEFDCSSEFFAKMKCIEKELRPKLTIVHKRSNIYDNALARYNPFD